MEILILFSALDWDKHFLAAYKDMPTKEEIEGQCFESFTNLEYAYFKAYGSVEKNGHVYSLQKYTLK